MQTSTSTISDDNRITIPCLEEVQIFVQDRCLSAELYQEPPLLNNLFSSAKAKVLSFQLHHAVHNMSKKPLSLFWRFRPSTSNYNDTLYDNLKIQDLSIRHKTRYRAERQFTQILLSDGGQKKSLPEKNLWGEKGRQQIWIRTMAQALNSPSYEAT